MSKVMKKKLTLAQRLAISVRRRRGSLSLRAAAEEIGISASTLMRVEEGAHNITPSFDVLEKISAWLNTPLFPELPDACPSCAPGAHIACDSCGRDLTVGKDVA